jgi:hypothetical protein
MKPTIGFEKEVGTGSHILEKGYKNMATFRKE